MKFFKGIRHLLGRIVRRIIRIKPIYYVGRGINRCFLKLFPNALPKMTKVRNRLFGYTNSYEVQQEMDSYEEAEGLLENGKSEEETEAERAEARERMWRAMQWKEEQEMPMDSCPLISVIVPNYNHSAYLRERLDTIYNQTYPNYEVILLDDCSTDNSREILTEYAEKYPEKTRTAFNEQNAGKVFLQWNKGLSLAKGDFIWIAESDDYSEPTFLEEMIKCFRYSSVMLAFARSVFMQEGKQIWSTEEYLNDVKNMRWDEPFVLSAPDAVRLGFGYKNIIPNVSSCVFRNIGKVPDDVVRVCSNMHLSSDWIFYLCIMKGGCLSYTNKATNFYRIHQESTSLKVQQTMRYYDEYEMVSQYVAENYEVSEELFRSILSYLLWHYKATQHVQDAECVKEHYRIDMLLEKQKNRKPNIAMGCFSLQSGGGETYPIYLANELHRQGCNVTLIDFNLQNFEEEVHRLVDSSVPLLRMRNPGELIVCLKKLNIDVIHTHHASVDEIAGKLLNGAENFCKHVITLHGMYETVDDANLEHLFDVTGQSCSRFFYIADKNLNPFKKFKMMDKVQLQKIDNGLPMIPVTPEKRADYGIAEDAFVLCVVSRGIPEKGWKEAIESVKLAREKVSRPIELVIVGDGDIREELEKSSPSYIHFMGKRSNVRDFFAMSDAGFLPTRFAGESYPLVVIESMMCGKPVIATDVAEVKHQLTDESGELSGLLLTMKDGMLDIEEIAEQIGRLSSDEELYRTMQERTKSAIVKFDIAEIVKKYYQVYCEVAAKEAE